MCRYDHPTKTALLAAALARQRDGRLLKRLAFGKLVGVEDPHPHPDPGRGRPGQHCLNPLEDNYDYDFEAFGLEPRTVRCTKTH